MANGLPPGFVIDEPQEQPSGLPAGFVVDQPHDATIGGDIVGGLEVAGSIVSGAIAEPLAGLAGIAQSVNPFADPGAGARAVEATRDFLTISPRTTAGQQQIQAVGEALAPVGEVLEVAESGLGDFAFEQTGNPAIAAFASSLPTAALELAGIKGGGRIARAGTSVTPTAGQVRSLLREAVPDANALRDVSVGAFRELSESGVKVKPVAFNRLANKIERATKEAGLDRRTTPKAAGALEAITELKGQSVSLVELDTLRKVARGAAGSLEKTEQALAMRIIDEIDDFVDTASGKQLTSGSIQPSEVGKKYKAARNLYGRAKKSELVQDAIEAAKGRASGFENGIRIELGKLIKNKRTKNFFTKAEKEAIQAIERGDKAQNFAKFLGRFAFNEGRSTNVLNALAGAGAGGVVGGGVGAIAVPIAGTAARRVARNLTKGRADFVDAMIRAGSDGQEIVKTYLQSVPVKKRNVADLSELLSDPSVDLDPLIRSANRRVREAAEIAAGRQIIGEAAGLAVASGVQSLSQEESK